MQCLYIEILHILIMAGVTETLEDKAEKIVKDFDITGWDNSIPAVLKREIALTVDQIKRLKGFHKDQSSKLDRTESDVGSELLQLEDRIPKYSPQKYPEQEKFQRQLIGLKGERRRQDIFYEDKLQGLHRNLLLLVQKYEQIRDINNGYRQNSSKTRTFNAKTGSALE